MGEGRVINAVNPTMDYLRNNFSGVDVGKLQNLAPLYYKYLTDPGSVDINALPTGTQYYKTAERSDHGYNIDYDQIRREIQKGLDTKAASDKAASDALAAEAAAKAKHQTDIGSAREIALRHGGDAIKQWGLDPSAYDSKLQMSIDDILKGLGDTADPYTSLNGEDIATKLLNADQTAKRNQLTQQANTQFGPNYGSKIIDSHLLDDTINDILGTQQGSAKQYLQRGQARGIYNDVGYNAGEKALTDQASAGKSQLGSIANSVLDKYRTKADTVRDHAYGAASGFTLGSPINLDDYVGQGNEVRQQAQDYGAGDLRSTVGGTNYFDFSGLTNAAGAAQGATNLRDGSVASALAEREKQKAATRGLGSQGAF